jgi:glyoxylase-like metal-dependent hydrolase (beta-lactamase superfamily II)
MVVHAQAGDDHVIFSGDVFHHPAQIQDPTLNLGVDTDPEAALAVRRQFVETYADTGTVLLAAHFPDPTSGCVVTGGSGPTFRFLDKPE